MTEPVKTIKIGGVDYVQSQVKNQKTNDVIYADESGNLKSKSVFNVELADGTKLSYEEQASQREAKVFKEGNWTKLFGLENAEITDTPKDDHYDLIGCKNCEIKADRVHAEGLIFKDLVSDDEDMIDIRHRKMNDGSIQASEKNSVYLGNRDWYFDSTKDTGSFGNEEHITE